MATETKARFRDALATAYEGIARVAYEKADPAGKTSRDKFYLELAKHLTMKPDGMAAEYLEHFLQGSGKPKSFSIARLLAANNGIRQRITSEALRRTLGIKTEREKSIDARMSLAPAAARSRERITIFQHNFDDIDWHYAIGTFEFEFALKGRSVDGKRMFIELWGTNDYQWHPDDGSRATQFLHQAGDRLARSGKAANFKIVADPTIITVIILNREVLEMISATQWNPKVAGEGSIGNVPQAISNLSDMAAKHVGDTFNDCKNAAVQAYRKWAR